MTELVFEATIVGLCSDRYPPTGWEDKYIDTFEKDKTSVKKRARVVVEKDFRSVENPISSGKVKEGQTETGKKSYPLYRFARERYVLDATVPIDTKVLGSRLIRKNIWGALNQSAGFFGDGNTGGMSLREKQGLGVKVDVKEFDVAKYATYDIYKLIGGHGSGQCYSETLESVEISGRIFSYAGSDITLKTARAIETLRIGPFRQGELTFSLLEVA